MAKHRKEKDRLINEAVKEQVKNIDIPYEPTYSKDGKYTLYSFNNDEALGISSNETPLTNQELLDQLNAGITARMRYSIVPIQAYIAEVNGVRMKLYAPDEERSQFMMYIPPKSTEQRVNQYLLLMINDMKAHAADQPGNAE
ncbi:MAG: hypothetical protein ABF679_12550 [Lentilactobacillus diolivorans]|jgi:hypothetical protein|uniref:hypothetical protein n=1 Tax=Lentilactobacillus diolivorans TaxID=179838 RepID=UPI000FF16C01|nr:hypothetical protein [Lentilactobacillus diolivorans]MCH4165021.1 hypothetical protein [Lentilactobacillus diolivorans]MDH5107174.1 hypothetical protein [Lentilactobacillus diolivorans]RRG00999.1 MAG: hypothetical protein DUD34_13615 [Lactobacillus sp.]